MENNGSDQAASDYGCLVEHGSLYQSPCLQSTLTELDRKIMMILELVEDNGDTFAQRAEMYYQKRPELIEAVVDIRRSYLTLANKYNLLKSEVHCGSTTNSFILQDAGKGMNPRSCEENGLHVSESVENPELVMSKDACEMLIASGGDEQRSNCNNGDVDDINKKISGVYKNEGFDSKRDCSGISINSEREKMWNKMRMSLSELIKDNLSQQAELIRRNDKKREYIKELGLYISQLQKDNRLLKDSLRNQNIDHFKHNRSHISKLKRLVFGKKL